MFALQNACKKIKNGFCSCLLMSGFDFFAGLARKSDPPGAYFCAARKCPGEPAGFSCKPPLRLPGRPMPASMLGIVPPGWPPVLGISDLTLSRTKEKVPTKWLRPPSQSLTMVGSSPKFHAVARSCMTCRAVIQRLAIDMLGELLIGISDLTLPKVKERLPL